MRKAVQVVTWALVAMTPWHRQKAHATCQDAGTAQSSALSLLGAVQQLKPIELVFLPN